MFDRDAVLHRVGDDPDLLVVILNLFLDDCPQRLADIEAAVAAGDAEAVRTTAHALRGSASTLSADRLTEAAAALERLGAEGRVDGADTLARRVAEEAHLVMAHLRTLVAA